MIASKIIKTHDGTIIFVDHIVSIAKDANNYLLAHMVDGRTITLSPQGNQQATTILGNHVHLIGTWN